MELTPAYVEAIVKRAWKKGKVLRVLEVKVEGAVEEGDNYTSDTKRLSASVVDTDGKARSISFFIKMAPNTPAKRAFIMSFALFPREIQVYRDVLPAMEELLRGEGDFSECPWTSCLDFTPNMILLQDLSLSDFQMASRKEGLDMEHAALAVGALARFHALSVVLREREELKTSDFDRFIFAEENPITERLFCKGLTALIETIETSWSSDWSELVKDMKTLLVGSVIGKIKKIVERDEGGFNVLNHGDPWTNNMLFKYCPYTGRLVGIKLVDLQLSHYGSLAIDLAYLMYTSGQGEVRERVEELLAAYHKNLLDTFRRVRHEARDVPTLEDVVKEYRRREGFGLIVSIAMLHMFIADKEDVKDLEEAVSNPDLQISQTTLHSERFTRKVQEILGPFKQGGYFTQFSS